MGVQANDPSYFDLFDLISIFLRVSYLLFDYTIKRISKREFVLETRGNGEASGACSAELEMGCGGF